LPATTGATSPFGAPGMADGTAELAQLREKASRAEALVENLKTELAEAGKKIARHENALEDGKWKLTTLNTENLQKAEQQKTQLEEAQTKLGVLETRAMEAEKKLGDMEGLNRTLLAKIATPPVQQFDLPDTLSKLTSFFVDFNKKDPATQARIAETIRGHLTSLHFIVGQAEKFPPRSLPPASLTDYVPTSRSNSSGTEEYKIAISPKKSLQDYVLDWKGDTPKARATIEGIRELERKGFKHVITIRGDNYCGIRSVLFSLLVSGVTPQLPLADFDEFVSLNPWVKKWRDGLEVPRIGYEKLRHVLSTVGVIQHRETRITKVTELLNEDLENFLMEGLKFQMLARARQLYLQLESQERVSSWVSLLFARHECTTPEAFLTSILNLVGDKLGLEQVEMTLLADTLSVDIRAFRLIQVHSPQDFETFFRGNDSMSRPAITICTIDDRHYNVPL